MSHYRNDPYTGYESVGSHGLSAVRPDWVNQTQAQGMITPQREPHVVTVRVPDMVRQPAHYARFVIEPVTFILANKLPYDVGNVIKYVCRYDAKNGLEDLEKAKRYVEIIIERVKREERVKNGEKAQTVWSEII